MDIKTTLLESVVAGLQARKGDWPAIAEQSGVPYDTISKIARGATPNPGVLTVQALAACLQSTDRAAA